MKTKLFILAMTISFGIHAQDLIGKTGSQIMAYFKTQEDVKSVKYYPKNGESKTTTYSFMVGSNREHIAVHRIEKLTIVKGDIEIPVEDSVIIRYLFDSKGICCSYTKIYSSDAFSSAKALHVWLEQVHAVVKNPDENLWGGYYFSRCYIVGDRMIGIMNMGEEVLVSIFINKEKTEAY